MSVTPTGLMGDPLLAAQTLLCNAAAFRTYLGVSTVAAARARTYFWTGPNPSVETLPFAVVDIGRRFNMHAEAGGGQNHYVRSGSVLLGIFGDIPEAYRYVNNTHSVTLERDAGVHQLNQLSLVIADMLALSGSDAYMSVMDLDLESGPDRPEFRKGADFDDYYLTVFRLDWI